MKSSLFADGVLFFIAFVWGATFVLVQNAIAFLDPITFNALRFAIATLFLTGIFMIRAREAKSGFSLPLVKSGVFLGIWLFGGYALQTIGLMYTSPSKAGFITGLSVVLVPLLSFLLLKQKVKWPAAAGTVLAVIGLFLLTLGDSFTMSGGDLLVLGCTVCYAMQIVYTGKFAPHFSALPLAIVQLTAVAVFSCLYAFLFENWQAAFRMDIMFTSEVAWGLFITSIPATALAFLAQTAFQKKTSPTHVALIFALEPVFAALTSFVWNGELLTGRQLTGCAFIFIGMLLAELPLSSWLKTWKDSRLGRSPKRSM